MSSRSVFLNRRDLEIFLPGLGIILNKLNMTEIVELSQWKKYLNYNSSKICIYFGIFGCMQSIYCVITQNYNYFHRVLWKMKKFVSFWGSVQPISLGTLRTPVFTQLKLYFNIRVVLFSKFLHVKNQIYQWNMQKIIALIFLIWRPQSLTRTVDVEFRAGVAKVRPSEDFLRPLCQIWLHHLAIYDKFM